MNRPWIPFHFLAFYVSAIKIPESIAKSSIKIPPISFYTVENVLKLRNCRTPSNLSIPSSRITIIATVLAELPWPQKHIVANKQRNLVGWQTQFYELRSISTDARQRDEREKPFVGAHRQAATFFLHGVGLVIIDIFIETIKIGVRLVMFSFFLLCDSALPHLSSASALECRKSCSLGCTTSRSLGQNDRLWKKRGQMEVLHAKWSCLEKVLLSPTRGIHR